MFDQIIAIKYIANQSLSSKIPKILLLTLTLNSLFATFDFSDPCKQITGPFLPEEKSYDAQEFNDFPNMNLTLDFLYWKGAESGLGYALKNEQALLSKQAQVHELDFRYNPAFRIGIGTPLASENWNVEFFYTSYYSSIKNSAKHHSHARSKDGIRAVWMNSTSLDPLWQESKAEWKLQAHLVDLYLKHPFSITSHISIEPALGLNFAILQQGYEVNYKKQNNSKDNSFQLSKSQVVMKNRSFNLGIGTKIESKWAFSDHFDLLGKISGSLLASQFDVGHNEQNTYTTPLQSTNVESFRKNEDFWSIRPTASILLGLGWNTYACFPKSVLHYGLNVSYEALFYWSQNMLFRFIDQTNIAMSKPVQGNLYFHGLSIEGFIDF